MSNSDRRDLSRVPVEVFFNAYIDERLHRALALNLSPEGLYLHRPMARDGEWRDTRLVQVELPVPGSTETIWAAGEILRDELNDFVLGAGVRFTALARVHLRLLHDFVHEQRQRLRETIRVTLQLPPAERRAPTRRPLLPQWGHLTEVI